MKPAKPSHPTPVRRADRSRLAMIVVAVMAIVVAGCGISTDVEPYEIADAPDPLFPTTTEPPVPDVPEPEYTIPLHFVDDDLNQLVIIDRPSDSPATIQESLTALAAQPLEDELEAEPGISSRLPAGLEPTAEKTDATLRVNVIGNRMTELSETEPLRVQLIYAQIVCTIVEMDIGVNEVQIFDEMGPIPVVGLATSLDRPIGINDLDDGCKTREVLLAEAEADAEAEAEAEADGTGTTSSTASG